MTTVSYFLSFQLEIIKTGSLSVMYCTFEFTNVSILQSQTRAPAVEIKSQPRSIFNGDSFHVVFGIAVSDTEMVCNVVLCLSSPHFYDKLAVVSANVMGFNQNNFITALPHTIPIVRNQ